METKKYWLRGGILFTIIVIIALGGVAISEYTSCSPVGWTGMCGTAIGFAGIISGLGLPAIILNMLGPDFFSTNKDLSYIQGALLFIVIDSIIYFFVGAVVGQIFGKIKNKKSTISLILSIIIVVAIFELYYPPISYPFIILPILIAIGLIKNKNNKASAIGLYFTIFAALALALGISLDFPDPALGISALSALCAIISYSIGLRKSDVVQNYNRGFAGVAIIIILALGALAFGAYKIYYPPFVLHDPVDQNTPIGQFPTDYKPADHADTVVSNTTTNGSTSAQASCGFKVTSVSANQKVAFPLVISGIIDNNDSKKIGCGWGMFEGVGGSAQLYMSDIDGVKQGWYSIGMPVPIFVENWATTTTKFKVTVGNDQIGLRAGMAMKIVFTEDDAIGIANPDTFELPLIYDGGVIINTSDWKIYNNQNYRFAFKYPGEWEIKGDGFYRNGFNQGNVFVDASTDHLSLKEKEAANKKTTGEPVETKLMVVNGVEVLKTKFGGNTQSPPSSQICFIADDALVCISGILGNSTLVNSIISSIRLTI